MVTVEVSVLSIALIFDYRSSLSSVSFLIYRSCKGCVTNDVRLQVITLPATGRVEVCSGGMWYSICAPSDLPNSLFNVVCRQLDSCYEFIDRGRLDQVNRLLY